MNYRLEGLPLEEMKHSNVTLQSSPTETFSCEFSFVIVTKFVSMLLLFMVKASPFDACASFLHLIDLKMD